MPTQTSPLNKTKNSEDLASQLKETLDQIQELGGDKFLETQKKVMAKAKAKG